MFEAEEDGSRYSVDLDIRTGVTVYGNKNVVCDGVPGKSGNKTTAQATKEKDQTELVVGRKRRAASVCFLRNIYLLDRSTNAGARNRLRPRKRRDTTPSRA